MQVAPKLFLLKWSDVRSDRWLLQWMVSGWTGKRGRNARPRVAVARASARASAMMANMEADNAKEKARRRQSVKRNIVQVWLTETDITYNFVL